MIRENNFREDLYYRIAILEIEIAPLRTRPSDIPLLIKQRLLHEQQLTANDVSFQIDEPALKALTAYEWPGNVRQLHNIISRLISAVNGKALITEADVFSILPHEPIEEGSLVLPADARFLLPNEDLSAYVARVQLLAIDAAMQSEKNHTLAAKRLGYRRTSLAVLIRKLEDRGHRRGIRTRKVQPQASNKNFQYRHQQQNKSMTNPFNTRDMPYITTPNEVQTITTELWTSAPSAKIMLQLLSQLKILTNCFLMNTTFVSLPHPAHDARVIYSKIIAAE